MKYYYKSLDNKAVWCLKQPIQPENSIEITEEDFNEIKKHIKDHHNQQQQ